MERISANAMAAKLNGQKAAGGTLDGLNALPYLIFSSNFTGDTSRLKEPTGLLVATINCPGGWPELEKWRKLVCSVPLTMLAFVGSSQTTLKFVVKCNAGTKPLPTDAGQYVQFLNDAQYVLAEYYRAVIQCAIVMRQQTLATGCRMSYDPKLYYNPDAQELCVIQKAANEDGITAGAKVDCDGNVSYPAEETERSQNVMKYQQCLGKALGETDGSDEILVQNIAENCHALQLPEEMSVVRTIRQSRIHLEEDCIRKVFSNVYFKKLGDKPVSMMSKQQLTFEHLRDLFSRRYEIRYNRLSHKEEFRKRDGKFGNWQTIDDRQLKMISVEGLMEGGHGWSQDVETYIRSAIVQDYDPVKEFLYGCGKWDGKKDYIGMMADRVPNRFKEWKPMFHRWFLAMVAQWLNMNDRNGNSVMPMLIGAQKSRKTTFCRMLLPMYLRDYFKDDIHMTNSEQVERMMGSMLLVNLDEYDSKTPREVAKIKKLLTEKNLQIRHQHQETYEQIPRMASFIGNTNQQMPLTDPSGSRRYLCVEVTGTIDIETPVNYQQMYAQAMAELARGDRYWFESDEEDMLMQHNMAFTLQDAATTALLSYYEPAPRSKDFFMKSIDMLAEIDRHLKAQDQPSLRKLTDSLRDNHFQHGSIDGQRGWYARRVKVKGGSDDD